jgi:hypothetical protein
MPSTKKGHYLAGDMERIASVALALNSKERGRGLKGWMLGPPNTIALYTYTCGRVAGRDDEGMCSTYVLQREIPSGGPSLKQTVSVGNIHGLIRQLSRDAARLWGEDPGETSGFEGVKRRRKKRK